MHSIAFELHVHPSETEDGQPCREAWVSATIEGRTVGSSGAPLEFIGLLARRGLSTEAEVLTCSCGVAGCAGFHQDVIQTWGDAKVTWSLAAEEYGFLEWLPADPAIPGNLLVTMSRKRLEAGMSELLAQLRRELANGPLRLLPGSDDEPVEDFAEIENWIDRARQGVLDGIAREEKEQEVFGSLAQAVVRARFPCGTLKEASVRTLLMDLLLTDADDAGIFEQQACLDYAYAHVRSTWRPQLEADPELLLARLRAMSWNDAFVRFYNVLRIDTPGAQSDAEAWPKASLELVFSARR